MKSKSTVLHLLAFVLILDALSLQASAQQNIAWRYTDSSHFPPSTPLNGWYRVNNAGFNLSGYAITYAALRGGTNASVYLVANNAFGWQMNYYVPARRVWIFCGFDMVAVAQWQGYANGYNRLPKSMENWGVYFTDFNNPFSWRGVYWISK